MVNQTAATVATGDLVLINDIDDSNAPKKVTAQSIADLATPATPTWTTATVTVNNGGTLTYDTDYSRYYIDGKILYWQFSITQTNAGTGSSPDLSIDAPGSVTLLDSSAAGFANVLDMGNNNIYKVMGVEAFSSDNTFRFTFTDQAIYIRGGSFIGNNGTVNISANIICGIA